MADGSGGSSGGEAVILESDRKLRAGPFSPPPGVRERLESIDPERRRRRWTSLEESPRSPVDDDSVPSPVARGEMVVMPNVYGRIRLSSPRSANGSPRGASGGEAGHERRQASAGEEHTPPVDAAGNTELHYTACAASGDSLRALIRSGRFLDLDARNTDGDTPLHLAVTHGNIDIIQTLLEAGANPLLPNREGHPALVLAAIADAPLVVCEEILVGMETHSRGRGVEGINLTGASGFTALHWACVNRSPEVVAALLEVGADWSLRTGRGQQASHKAAEYGALDCLALLLKAGASCNSQDADGRTPLHVAARTGQADILQMLLTRHGVDVNEADGKGCTALYHAITRDHNDLVPHLVEWGADDSSLKPTEKGRLQNMLSPKTSWQFFVDSLADIFEAVWMSCQAGFGCEAQARALEAVALDRKARVKQPAVRLERITCEEAERDRSSPLASPSPSPDDGCGGGGGGRGRLTEPPSPAASSRDGGSSNQRTSQQPYKDQQGEGKDGGNKAARSSRRRSKGRSKSRSRGRSRDRPRKGISAFGSHVPSDADFLA